jgi:dihydroorotate dehydrogenase
MECTYKLSLSWDDNCRLGPQFSSAEPSVPQTPLKEFLGIPVHSRIGIAAGLLPNSRWLLPYARRGFDLLTWKTVRTSARACYPLPNWVFVDPSGPEDGPVYVVETPSSDPLRMSSAVCFGMPSADPREWQADLRMAAQALPHGKALIVSVVASPEPHWSLQEIAVDFARCAELAIAAGAQIIEANLSCPNVCSAEGTLYHDGAASRIVARQIRDAIGNVPLLLKIGLFPDAAKLSEFLHGIHGIADGITLVNCITREVLRADGQPAFGVLYRRAGVLGHGIHAPSVAAVRTARSIIDEAGLRLKLVAVGGVATVSDIADFFAAGAEAVLCGSSPMYLPHLAVDAKTTHPEW